MRPDFADVYSQAGYPYAVLYPLEPLPQQAHPEIELDTPAWFAWLDLALPFRLTYYPADGPAIQLTIRPQIRGSHTYWYAHKTLQGQAVKKYLAPSDHLTKDHLDRVGLWFFQQAQLLRQRDPAVALQDLVVLAQRLIVHCRDPALAQFAKKEVARIQHLGQP